MSGFIKHILISIGLVLCFYQSKAQIIPPGLGETNAASWLAFGIQQDLDTQEGQGWSSVSYLGFGRMSHPDGYNLFQKPSIFILNQEFKKKFLKNWEHSLALSYRSQKNYVENAPYERDDPKTKQEFRIYGRLSRVFQTSFVEITPTFRQEVQRYFTGDFISYSEKMRLRSRFRLKFKFPLSSDGAHKMSLYSEQLFSSSLHTENKKWTRFEYKDSRFSLYYTFSPKTIPWDFNLGYMNNMIGRKDVSSVHHLGLDVIWKNPFKK